jgi:hypothetical protein
LFPATWGRRKHFYPVSSDMGYEIRHTTLLPALRHGSPRNDKSICGEYLRILHFAKRGGALRAQDSFGGISQVNRVWITESRNDTVNFGPLPYSVLWLLRELGVEIALSLRPILSEDHSATDGKGYGGGMFWKRAHQTE